MFVDMFVHEIGIICAVIFDFIVMTKNTTTPVIVDHRIDLLVLLYLLHYG